MSAAVHAIDLRLKQEHEDFQVEEWLSFVPSGAGEHLFLFLEKRGRTTPSVARELARHFEVELKDVGWAGRKDARGVTRQWFSVRGAASEGLEALEAEDLRVLEHTRNDRKLRLGAIAGNRFELLLRGVAETDRPHAEEVLRLVSAGGLPNYFGRQRFGMSGRAAELGLLLLQGRARAYLLRRLHTDHTPATEATLKLRGAIVEGRRATQRKLGDLCASLPHEFASLAMQLARRPGDWNSALRALDRPTLGLHLSAWQSAVFNAVLSERFDQRQAPLVGDIMQLSGSHSLFHVGESEDLEALRARALAQEISISGPLPGERAPQAQGVPGSIEADWISRAGMPDEGPRLPVKGLQLPGSRRALVVPVLSLRWSWQAAGLQLTFALPAGSYATSLVTELTRVP